MYFPTEESGTADTWNAEEAQVDTDSESNVYAMWMGYDICHTSLIQLMMLILGLML